MNTAQVDLAADAGAEFILSPGTSSAVIARTKERLNERDVRIHYYREHSAASRLQPEDIDEAYIAGANICI
ncbi:hypothetical protein D3C75_808110 [compost metagenome]